MGRDLTIRVGDYVTVVFSDKHTEIGQVKSINEEQDFKYCVVVKIYGKDIPIFCKESDVQKYFGD